MSEVAEQRLKVKRPDNKLAEGLGDLDGRNLKTTWLNVSKNGQLNIRVS